MSKEDLLNKYFEQTLTDEEKIRFEQFLKEDMEFQEEFNFQKDVKLALTLNERSELKAKLKSHHSKKSSFKRQWKISIATAAAVVLCFGIYSIFNSNPSAEQLFSQYYETYPNTVLPIVRDASSDQNIKQQAFEAYENKNYQKAIELFSNIYTSEGDEYALFYKAMSMIESNHDLENAKTILKDTQWTIEFKEKSLWYLGMVYLKQQQTEQAKTTLQKLSALGDYRKVQVEDLIKKL